MAKTNKHDICLISIILLLLLTFSLNSCDHSKRKYLIGVSQCSDDIWRDKLNTELRMATYFYDDIDLKISTANDNVKLQRQQIEEYIKDGVDLLIVSPIQTAEISPAIDEAYDKGIPVIVFDRKTNSNKFTTYIGANNYEMGRMMGEFVANGLGGHGNVVEIIGMKGSSPAADRSKGFDDAIKRYPGVNIVAKLQGDWKEESGYAAMKEFIKQNKDFGYVFGQNDRMAMGARKAIIEAGIKRDIQYCGIDALPEKGGGMELVRDGYMSASCIYPTHGDEVLKLAVEILKHKPYKKDNRFKTALVTPANANVLLMQNEESKRQANELDKLHSKSGEMTKNISYQRSLLFAFSAIIFLLIIILGYSYYAYKMKAKLNMKLKASYDEQTKLAREMQAMKNIQEEFYTKVSHELRTPLTLIASPVERLANDNAIRGSQHNLLEVMQRNVNVLVNLVNGILDFQKNNLGKAENPIETTSQMSASLQGEISKTSSQGEKSFAKQQTDQPETTILIVEDNDDMRYYIRYILQDKYNVIEAPDGKEGLDKARQEVPELIISDVMMPVMNGLELCSEIKNDVATSHIPVILLTARALEEQKAEGYEHGADAYLTKPFSAHLLISRVENLLKSRRQLHQIFAESKHEEEEEAVLGDKDRTFIDRLRSIIKENLSNSNLSVDDIASEIGLSRTQLYRKVKTMTGKAPMDILRSARLARAQVFLRKTDQTISEICYDVGFTSPSYFAKCYKEEFGVGPSEERNSK